MHGVKRTRQSREAIEARKEKEKAKLASYLELTDKLFELKSQKDWSKAALDLTTQILNVNPELYTAWNYRRDILTTGIFPSSPPDVVNNLLNNDLNWTMSSLRQHPKVYWIWNHRQWCLENIPNQPSIDGDVPIDPNTWRNAAWAKELFVVEKMLDADARNFHAWNYRRYVLASVPEQKLEQEELAYTTRKIEANFSNFSAWHQRSKVLSALWSRGEHNTPEIKDAEFELLKQAMYTDPNDQSVWLYHKWLMGPEPDAALLEREITVIKELLEVEPDSKWCLESLVHYGLALQRLQLGNSIISVTECRGMLSKLKTIDPMRRQRYEDLAAQLNQ
jgi:geranylgeranyl transferase type-2 subunit alpha